MNQEKITLSQLESFLLKAADYQYECSITAEYPPANDGMTYIRVWRNNGRWSLRAQFGRHPETIDELAS